MKGLLQSLLGFAKSMLGLVVVVILVVVYLNPESLFNNLGNLTLLSLGGILGLVLTAIAIIWAQLKNKVILSHLILLIVFGGFLSTLFNHMINGNWNSIDYYLVLGAAAALYTVLVVIAAVMYDKPQTSSVDFKSLFSIGLLALVFFLLNGLTSVILVLFPILVALYLGSKVVALLYATAAILPPVFLRLHLIFTDASVISNYFYLIGLGIVAFFIILDLSRSIANGDE